LTEQRQEKPLEGSIKWIKIKENRNKIQGVAVFHDRQLGTPYFVKECKTLFDKAFEAKFRESTIFKNVSIEH
jgi:hypothetical protein